nr:hypothetical protein [Abalone asfa-like virus]
MVNKFDLFFCYLTMIAIYTAAIHVYWLVIVLRHNMIPEPDVELFITDHMNNSLQFYHVSENNQFYILLETAKENNNKLTLYLNTPKIPRVARVNGKFDMAENFRSTGIQFDKITKQPKTDITHVISRIPHDSPHLPTSVTAKFLDKYPIRWFSFPPISNAPITQC